MTRGELAKMPKAGWGYLDEVGGGLLGWKWETGLQRQACMGLIVMGSLAEPPSFPRESMINVILIILI